MLELQNIKKDYQLADTKIEALKGINLAFREQEFVAILGPSGCGKTTLLNIIGGLDQYTSGDLLINGRSTKDYKDRDWDTYRNHTIGFVFQSYNLIPHQTVLQNVELSLTISGLSKAERRKRAAAALEQVGLGDQLNKKPNQISGGQSQRVAIARALVTDPDIILADEPTGALDSATSVQVMDILKEVAKTKLVIMVTHNPDLAKRYATRLIVMKDGLMQEDSDPYTVNEKAPIPSAKQGKAKMHLLTAFSLSWKNLMTKIGRTLLTAFAGSIGIIGIALIFSLSNGIQIYIDTIQEETLSSYPLQIEAQAVDQGQILQSLMNVGEQTEETDHADNRVYSKDVMFRMMSSMSNVDVKQNNMPPFVDFLEHDSQMKDHLATTHYSYSVNFPVYTKDPQGEIFKADIMEIIEKYSKQSKAQNQIMEKYSPLANVKHFEEMVGGEQGELVSPMITNQYDLVEGSWPANAHEAVVILNKNNEISDMALYALGFKDQTQIEGMMDKMAAGKKLEKTPAESWDFATIMNKEYKIILPSEAYSQSTETGGWTDMSITPAGRDYLYNDKTVGIPLKISGIIRPKKDSNANLLQGAIGYTTALTKEIVGKNNESKIIREQLDHPDRDVLANLPFRTPETKDPSTAEKATAFQNYISLQNTEKQAEMYAWIRSQMPKELQDKQVEEQMEQLTRPQIEAQVVTQYATEMKVDASQVQSYVAGMSDDQLFGFVREGLAKQMQKAYAEQVAGQIAMMTPEMKAAALLQEKWSEGQYAAMYDQFMPPTVSDAAYTDNLRKLGRVSLDSPEKIYLYTKTFKEKDEISAAISRYNNQAAENDKITYTDYVALLMSSITSIVNGVSYLLVAFVAISLIVSSIMIGIITYISVLERTKEIGILRALGASKSDVSHVFNAETVLEGLAAGVLGVGVAWLLTFPINNMVHNATKIPNLSAVLPWKICLILIGISVLLTLIAGLFPSRLAAKKDPVEALRTE